MTSAAMSIVSIAIFIIGMMAAMDLLRGKMPKVPVLGGKFSGKAE